MLLAWGVRGFLGVLAGFSVIISALVILQMFLLSDAIDSGSIQQRPVGMVSIYLLVGVILVRGLLYWLREWKARQSSVTIRSELRRKLFDKLIRLGPAYTRSEKTGGLIATLTEGVDKTDDYFSRYIPSLIHIVILPPVIILFTLFFDWISGVIMLVTGPLILFFMWLIGTYAGFLTKKQWGSLSRMSSHFLDALQGLKTLKLFNASEHEAVQVHSVSDKFRQATMKVLKVAFLSGLVLELAASISIALIAVQVGIRLIEGLMTFHPALFILLLAPEFYIPFRSLGAHHHAGMEGAAAADKVFDIIEGQTVEQANGQTGEQANSQTVEQANRRLGKRSNDCIVGTELGARGVVNPDQCKVQDARGTMVAPGQQLPDDRAGSDGERSEMHVVFSGVRFSYPGAEQPAVDDINICMQGGTTTALVGHTGSGKTTLAFLLLGFLRPGSGRILVNGMTLDAMNPAVWRRQVAYVPQHPHFFNASVLDNLLMAYPGAGMEQVIQAASDAGIHDVITRLPRGYHTLLSDNAARLSGGERQRLAIARAFLKNAPLLILDEPTSSLDPESEQVISKACRKLTKGRTTLIIAHRLQTVRESDCIVVLDHGRVAELGTHSTLLSLSGIYASYMQTLGLGKGGKP